MTSLPGNPTLAPLSFAAVAPAPTCSPACPGLSPTAQWDDAASLRGEIYTIERLEEHGLEVARSHGEPSLAIAQGALRARFVAARSRIREAYAKLWRETSRKREPSPAEEWLVDNSHVVEDQLREIEEDLPEGYLFKLPRLARGPMAGYPRVYGLCLDYLRHTDARIELESLARYVLAYQSVRTLTIGELWAVPIMLRLGLVLAVASSAASEASAEDGVRGDEWAERLLSTADRSSNAARTLGELEKEEQALSAPFLVQLLRRLREHDALGGEAFDWIQAQCLKLGLTPEELTRRQHLRQAADQVSVGNSITSMRAIGALDWNKFFERTSFVEAILRRDPANAYVETDAATRDRYRHAVEDLARQGHGDECAVATAAIELAEAARRATPDDPGRMHVGFHLVDTGRLELEALVGYRATWREAFVRRVLRHATAAYLGALAALTIAELAGLFFALRALAAPSPGRLSALVLLALLPATEVAITIVNGLVTSLLPPRLLAKLAFSKGIPAAHRTLVAVPTLLDNEPGIRRLLADLEVRSLANADQNLHFALVTDFTDHVEETHAADPALVALATAGIAELNRRYGRPDRYFLFHRRRLENRAQDCWMGWERKRGKLEELNRVLRGALDTTFTVVTAPAELLLGIRYVITLDADTELPREVARKLVAAIAHPLNRPVLDPATGRVVRGYGVIQPRIGTEPVSARRSRFARIMAGQAGIDPYTTAVSDVYQDLFGEGSYVGKAVYDVDAFQSALDGRVPDDRLLSHDLFEGVHARTALATDIELLDDQPASYAVVAGRQHRWIRGDWQLFAWLFGHVPVRGGGRRPSELSIVARWKLLDNLRRSLVPPSLVALLIAGWSSPPRLAALMTALVLAVISAPLFDRLVTALFRPRADRSPSLFTTLRADLGTHALRAALGVVFLLDQALVMSDAIGRTLYRLFVSQKHLLEWQATAQATRRHSLSRLSLDRRMFAGAILAIACGALLSRASLAAFPFAWPILVLWTAAPLFATWLSQPLPPRDPSSPLSQEDRLVLRARARKTWRFFETFVTPEDNFLPPDNYQEEPRGVVAHRTSPTNIGLYLLSTIAARDFGYIPLREVAERVGATLGTVERLERREGHVLNWYDTMTLRPLDPQYVSTVDSGNLAAYLWTMREACRELRDAPIVGPSTLDAALDAVALFEAEPDVSAARRYRSAALRAALEASKADVEGELPRALAALVKVGAHAVRLAREIHGEPGASGAREPARWLDQAHLGLAKAVLELRTLAPWAERLPNAPASLTSGPRSAAWEALLRCLGAARTPAALSTASLTAVAIVDVLGAALGGAVNLRDKTKAVGASFLGALRAELTRSHEACVALNAELTGLGERATALADAMNFEFLYNKDRALFSIGYNVGTARLDGSHYDLLASEARLASLVAIAKGDAPQEHWFRMARPRTALPSGHALVAWTGSMFEYLMPLLVTKSYEATLLDETYESAVLWQAQYGEDRGVPWGISESAYNTMDLSMTYQYRAFGVPGLGLKAGLGDDLVVAPYATALAALVRPDLAVRNLRALEREGLAGPFGYYESIDYTPTHVPPGRHGVVVKAYMAHHQGMTLVALDNVLSGAPMQRRFHRDPRIKASELLLEERVPLGTPLLAQAASVTAPVAVESEPDVVEHVGLAAGGPLRAHLLGHGDLSTLVTSVGTGITTWKGMDIHRFREDCVLEACGLFIYVRDLSTGEFWSGGYQPTRREPDRYDVAFSADRVAIHRRDGDIETIMEIGVSPEHPAEVRRITLTNHGKTPRELEVTTYTEVVLAPRAADLAHRAFSNLFVETEAFPERGAVLAGRRPRSPEEPEAWLVQVLTPEENRWQKLEFDCSRARLLGRGHSVEDPRALTEGGPLGAGAGAVLDPALALRRRVLLAPGKTARVALTTALASSRDEALVLADTYGAPPSIARTFELGWADARVELRYLGLSGAQAERSQRLLSAILFPEPSLRFTPEPRSVRGRSRDALWACGISGDLPILALRVDDSEFSDLCRELLVAHEFWRLNGIAVDLVIVNEEPGGYMQPRQQQLLALVGTSPGQGKEDQRGGVFVRRADQLPPDGHSLLLGSARVVLVTSRGSLARQLRSPVSELPPLPPPLDPPKKPRALAPTSPPRPKLVFDNGIGGFSADGRAYVMRIGPRTHTPAPWCNVVANEGFGCLLSESGSSSTWSGNSQSHRLTAWSNDPVCDPSGEAIYLRDEEDGSVWSPTPLPAGGQHPYDVTHGQGYSVFTHARGDLEHELTVFVDPNEPVKVSRLRLHNRGARSRTLSVYGVVEWVLGASRDRSRLTVVTDRDARTGALLAWNPAAPTDSCAFFTATRAAASATADREELFGKHGSRARPLALERAALAGRVGVGLDPCAALQIPVTLRPGESIDISFVLGEGRDAAHARELAAAFGSAGRVEASFNAARRAWDDVLGVVSVKTPDPALDLLLNRWLLYQVVSSRLWGRTAFYQSGGAYGFRDQLQDVLALTHARPDLARQHILRAAARQFVEGDVQHWWHAESGEGVRTRCSDDMLWLPYVASAYVRATGDHSILDEIVPFLEERALRPGELDLFSVPAIAHASASLYEHCARALDVGTTAGPNGLPRMRAGDWNDGMNRVGAGERGESVWLGWFLAKTLRDFIPVASSRGDAARAKTCSEGARRLGLAIDQHAWDGAWYKRAFFDDGAPLGSKESVECKIDAIAQSWAVLAGAGDPARAARALRSSREMLVREGDAMMLLFSPPFERAGADPGYIAAYPAGIRENGGQYTHGVLWTVLATALAGDGERAMSLLAMLNPIQHTSTPEAVARYAVEPYALAADVYAAPGHVGRGGWTWYTGAAGWMYRIALEDILGVHLDGGRLAFAPSVPSAWKHYEITYRHASSSFHIVVENALGAAKGGYRVELDGEVVVDGMIPLSDDGRKHEVRVVAIPSARAEIGTPAVRPVTGAAPVP